MLDAGVIVLIKRSYKRRLLLRVFENLEAEVKAIYNIDVFSIIRWAEAEWNDCPASVIQNCFSHCLTGGARNEAGAVMDDGELDSLSATAHETQEHSIADSSSLLSDNSHENGEDDVIKGTKNENFAREVANVQEGNINDDYTGSCGDGALPGF